MSGFRFRLESVLKYRQGVVEEHERKLKELRMEHARLIAAGNQLEHRRQAIEADSRSHEMKSGSDLRALSAFQISYRKAIAELLDRIRGLDLQIAQQLQLVMNAKREFKLMNKLRARKEGTWKKERDNELDANATDAYLAKWNRAENGQ